MEHLSQFEPCDIVQKNIDDGFYDPEFTDSYTKDEINELQSFIDPVGTNTINHAAMEQFPASIQYRIEQQVKFLKHQVAYMMIVPTLFAKYPRQKNEIHQRLL